MVKLVTHIKPKVGIDLEKFWEDWGGKYSQCYLGRSGLTHYTISRFLQNHGPSDKEDPNRLWGMEEFWYQDKQSHDNVQDAIIKDIKMLEIINEFQSQLLWNWTAWVEERLIVDSGYAELVNSGEKALKLQVTFGLREGQDPEDTWRLWIVGHSQHHLHCGVRKYVCNRVIKVLQGDENKIWGMPQIWYEDREACDIDHKELIETCRTYPRHKQILEDFHHRTIGNWGAFMEEKIII